MEITPQENAPYPQNQDIVIKVKEYFDTDRIFYIDWRK